MNECENYRDRFRNSDSAAKYAARFDRRSRRRINNREQHAIRKVFSGFSKDLTGLDVPSGAGRFIKNLSQDKRRVIEMDVSIEILRHARVKSGATPAQFVQGDAACLPLLDRAVDIVFCNRLLHHFRSAEQRMRILRELGRVTREYVVVSFFDYLAFGRLRQFLKRCKGRKVDYSGQPTLNQFRSEVQSCGFEIMDIVPTGHFWVAQKYFVLKKQALRSEA